MKNDLQGIITALTTPFSSQGMIDKQAFLKHLKFLVHAKVDGFVLAGSTGEAMTLSLQEYEYLLQCGFSFLKQNRQNNLIAGINSNDFTKACELADIASNAGAQYLLAATGYYNNPTQAGLAQYFTKLADYCKLPIILYNVPSRTGIDLGHDLIRDLSNHDNIIALKDASGELGRMPLYRQDCHADFILLSGDDPTFLGFLAMGGQGIISVSANLIPILLKSLYNNFLQGKIQAAQDDQAIFYVINQAIYADVNPVSIKYIFANLCLYKNYVRLPLLVPDDEIQKKIRDILNNDEYLLSKDYYLLQQIISDPL